MIQDEQGNPVDNPDLNLGHVQTVTRIKPDAAPLGNGKVAWADSDWETVQVYVQFSDAELTYRAKARLAATDYVAAKAMDALMGCTDADSMLAVLSGFRAEYADVLAEREELRRTVNELAGEV